MNKINYFDLRDLFIAFLISVFVFSLVSEVWTSDDPEIVYVNQTEYIHVPKVEILEVPVAKPVVEEKTVYKNICTDEVLNVTYVSAIYASDTFILLDIDEDEIKPTLAHEEVHAMILNDVRHPECGGSCYKHFCGGRG